MIDHLGQAEHTVGLRSGAWVGPRLTAIDRKAITRPWTGRRIGAFPPPTFELGHWSATPAGHEVDALFARRPHLEPMHQRLARYGAPRQDGHRKPARQLGDRNPRSALLFFACEQTSPAAVRNVYRGVGSIAAQANHEPGHYDQQAIADKADGMACLGSGRG